MTQKIARFLDWFETATVAIGVVALIACFLLVSIEVILRSTVGISTGISVEYSIYLFIFLVFMSFARAQSSGLMIYVQIGYDSYPMKAKLYLNLFRWILGLIYSAVVTVYLVHFTAGTCRLGQLSMYGTDTPLCWPQSILVVGMANITLRFLIGAIQAGVNVIRGKLPVEPAETETSVQSGF